jgi:hypothetical protein
LLRTQKFRSNSKKPIQSWRGFFFPRKKGTIDCSLSASRLLLPTRPQAARTRTTSPRLAVKCCWLPLPRRVALPHRHRPSPCSIRYLHPPHRLYRVQPPAPEPTLDPSLDQPVGCYAAWFVLSRLYFFWTSFQSMFVTCIWSMMLDWYPVGFSVLWIWSRI